MRVGLNIAQSVELSGGNDVIEIFGLGSCVAIFLAVPGRLMTGAHVLLPGPPKEGEDHLPGKYVTTAVPHLVSFITAHGLALSRVRAAVVGGAMAFSFSGVRPQLSIGSANVAGALQLLEERGIEVDQVEAGGSAARHVLASVGTGTVKVTVREPRLQSAAPNPAATT